VRSAGAFFFQIQLATQFPQLFFALLGEMLPAVATPEQGANPVGKKLDLCFGLSALPLPSVPAAFEEAEKFARGTEVRFDFRVDGHELLLEFATILVRSTIADTVEQKQPSKPRSVFRYNERVLSTPGFA
jgi:hypothetical protein